MAAVVSHGRRKGTARTQESNMTDHNGKVAILSMNDLERLKLQLSGLNLQKEEAKRRLDEKEAKHQLSLNKVKNWENTIDGQRIKRLQMMKIKQEKEEEEKLNIDEEEAKFQAERRREAIDHAKTLLYHQTERVKGFHSALLLSEISREREAQIAFKNKKRDIYKNQDEAFLRYQEEIREKSQVADMLTAQERTKAAKELSSYQLKQASEREAARKKERQLQLEEQGAIDKETEKWQESEREKIAERNRDKLNLRKELDELLTANKVAALNKEEEEKKREMERKTFAEAKQNMMKLRKAKETEIIKEFQHHQDKIATHVHGILKEKVSNEDERIAKAVAEETAKKEALEREKAEKHMKELKDIHTHCRNMIIEQESKKQEMKELDQELLHQRIAQDQKFHSNEFEKQRTSMSKAKELQKFHKAQMIEKMEREKSEKEEENNYYKQNLDLLKVEEDQFQQYASQVIEETKSKGSSLYPLKKASKRGSGPGHGPVFSAKGGVRPSYLPCASPVVELPTYTSRELPLSWRRVNTKKRMGFTW